MTTVFHEGERQVQRLAGVEAAADRVGKILQQALPDAAQRFLQEQRLAITASVSRNGQVWSSLHTGEPGFMQVRDARTIQFAGPRSADDPLWRNLRENSALGLLVIDIATRRRMRLNGTAECLHTGAIRLHLTEVFGNCTKYIQRRLMVRRADNGQAVQGAVQGALNATQQQLIRRADTFFIASHHHERGADASHRGGHPGFVQVISPVRLLWPDYAGNNMFQTLGNLAVEPQAGLLFVEWHSGRTLQVTGRASLIWDHEQLAAYPGAQRLLVLEVGQVIETTQATPYRWRLVDQSPDNPRH
jgi:predicted pyridoxine 5'-phosphate oxidase superfamily flavin-nucleotide-binding protein